MVKKSEKSTSKKDIAQVEELATKLLQLMGTKAKPKVSEDSDNDALVVDIDGGEESGLLIGSRGKTLSSLQVILGMMYRQKKGDWKRIIVNVSDWREKEEGRLRQLAVQTAERVKTTGEPQNLYNLTAAQRRVVHLTLAEDKSISTESQGEGNERYLIISPLK